MLLCPHFSSCSASLGPQPPSGLSTSTRGSSSLPGCGASVSGSAPWWAGERSQTYHNCHKLLNVRPVKVWRHPLPVYRVAGSAHGAGLAAHGGVRGGGAAERAAHPGSARDPGHRPAQDPGGGRQSGQRRGGGGTVTSNDMGDNKGIYLKGTYNKIYISYFSHEILKTALSKHRFCQAPTQLPTPSPLQPNLISTSSQFNSSKS